MCFFLLFCLKVVRDLAHSNQGGGNPCGSWPSVTTLSELLLLSKETKDKLSPKNLIFNLQLETSVLVLLTYILKKR